MAFDHNDHKMQLDETLINGVLAPAAERLSKVPKYPLNDIPKVSGVGVYALYIDHHSDTIYKDVLNKDYPVYVGKAVPTGTRQGKSSKSKNQLRQRLNEHKKSIEQAGLPIEAFSCGFVVMEGVGEDLIPAMEATLIRNLNPLWNSCIDGFGIHTPGTGRFNQQPSEWDTIHPGRPWLDKLTGAPRDKKVVEQKIKEYKMKNQDEKS